MLITARGCARPRKCGRPRVYDTVTPVLEAAEAAAAGVPPPVRRCRGAKPKYVCHTEQEAVAKRCDTLCTVLSQP